MGYYEKEFLKFYLMKKTLFLISILFCLITMSMAQTASSDYSTQNVLTESNEKEIANLSDSESDLSISKFEYVDQSAISLSGKEVFIYMALFLIGVFIGGWVTFYYSKKNIYSILDEERVYYLDYPPLKSEKSLFHYITLFHVLKRRKDSYKKHNKELRKEIDSIELENSALKKSLNMNSKQTDKS